MITLFIFYGHVVAAVGVYTQRWQDSGWKEGFLAVCFLLLIFAVGWSISTFILKLFIGEKGFGVWLDRDTLSLLLLTLMEAVFYSLQLKAKKKQAAAV